MQYLRQIGHTSISRVCKYRSKEACGVNEIDYIKLVRKACAKRNIVVVKEKYHINCHLLKEQLEGGTLLCKLLLSKRDIISL